MRIVLVEPAVEQADGGHEVVADGDEQVEKFKGVRLI